MLCFLNDICKNKKILITHNNEYCVMNYSHTHPQYELYFCTSSIQQKSIINGVEYKYSSPCVIISPPYTIHSMSCDDPDATVYDRFVIYFDKSILSSFSDNLIPNQLKNKKTGLFFNLTDDQASRLKELMLAADPQNDTESNLALALFLNKLVSTCPIENALTIETSSFYIQDILRYISENFANDISPTTVARRFAVSRSKLDRDFKLFTGSSVREFINSCRLNQAKIMLENTGERYISDIAKLCGFQSETYFFQFIKKHTGMTPTEYRKNKHNKNNSL